MPPELVYASLAIGGGVAAGALTSSKGPSIPSPTPVSPAPTEVSPEALKAKEDVRERRRRAVGRAKTRLTGPSMLKTIPSTQRPILSDELG